MKTEKDKGTPIPEPTLRRLPWYLAYVKLLMAEGATVVSSTTIARNVGVDPALVAKDLSFVDITGKTRVGYNIHGMIGVLENFLGFTEHHKAYVFGVGNLGSALLQDKGLLQYGIEVVGGFDVFDAIIAKGQIYDIPVYHLDEFPKVKEDDVRIGILAAPTEKAQEVVDIMVSGGIRAIWNFTPFRVIVPAHVVVQNTSLYSHLAVMYNRMKSTLDEKK